MNTTIRIASDVGADDLGALPVPYPALSVRAKGDLEADRSTLMLFDAGTALAGLQYSVTSLSDSPPEQALNSAPAPPAAISKNYLQVPAAYDSLRALAQSVVAGAGAKTSFEKAVALQNWLADGTFKYTLKAPTVLSASGLTTFLERTKSGYCQQFSFAMAVLARLLGIPSRVAYGFTSGTPTGRPTSGWSPPTTRTPGRSCTSRVRLAPIRADPLGLERSGHRVRADLHLPAGQQRTRQRHPPGADLGADLGRRGKGASPTCPPTCAPRSPAGTGARAAARQRRAAPGVNPWEVFGLVVAVWSSSGWRRRGRRGW